MKKLLALTLLLIATNSFAEFCTFVIQDPYGYQYQSFTRDSYSYPAACSNAQWDCQRALSDAQSVGRYYNAICIEQFRNPYPNPYPPQYPSPYPPPRYPTPYPPREPREPHWPRDPHRDPREPQWPREPDRHEPDRREPDRREPPREPHWPR